MLFYWRILYFLACVIVIVWCLASILFRRRSKTHRALCRALPYPKPLIPAFGNAYKFGFMKQVEIMDHVAGLLKTHGPVVYLELLGLPNVILNDPSDIERVLTSNLHITKGVEYNTLFPWLCEGLLTSTGAKWQQRRRLLTPTFHFKILETYLSAFNENARLLTNKLSNSKEAVDIDQNVSLCTLDAICETIMGTHLGSQMGLANDYVQAIRDAGEVVLIRSVSFWIRNEFVFYSLPIGKKFKKAIDHLHRFTEQVIKERKEIYKAKSGILTEDDKPKYRKAFLDFLIEIQCENPESMTDLDIREEVDTFMFEGHDTTSVSISWTFYLLGRHPDIQEKAREELVSIFGNSDRDCTMEDLHQMTYLEMIIKESLRLYPSVPYISRYLKDDLHLKNYCVPARTNISIMPYLVHRNAEIYPQPEKFDPNRFLPDVIKSRHPFAFIPFSAGYRNCIGQKFALMEAKVILSTILRHLKIHAGQNESEIKILPQMILRPTPKLLISFKELTSDSYTTVNGKTNN